MMKRSNPFAEDFIPQSKTHVGLKQFNNNEERMQKVYEKTLHLLFKGAKKLPEEVSKTMDVTPPTRKDCMKQLQINKDGTLFNSKTIDSGKNHIELSPHIQKCVCDSRSVESQCSYCEVLLCIACRQHCARCHLSFCSKCSVSGSESTEICVSCYG